MTVSIEAAGRWGQELATQAWRRSSELFPAAPVSPRPTGKRWALGAGVVAAAAIVSLLRTPGAFDTLWAEDGQIFLAGAVNDPFGSIFTSYAGYYHLAPRLLAEVVALVPAGGAAAMTSILAAVTTASLALFVYHASAGHLEGPGSRFLVAAVCLVVPLAQDDLPNSLANLHWYGHYAVFWALIWTPQRRAGRNVALAVVLLTAASDILTLVFIPLAVLRLTRRRDRHAIALAIALGVGLLLQFVGLLTGASSRDTALDVVLPATGFVLRVVPGALTGQHWLGSEVDFGWLVLAAFAWIVAGVVVAAALRGRTRPEWALAAAALIQSVFLYALPVLLSGIATPRYAAAPAMLVTVALVAVLQPPSVQTVAAPVFAALSVLLVVVWTVNLRVDGPRADGPRWSTAVTQARAACAGKDSDRANISISGTAPMNWVVGVPCGYLQR